MSQPPTTNQPPNLHALPPIAQLFPHLQADQHPTQAQTQTQTQTQHSDFPSSQLSSSSMPTVLLLPPLQGRPTTTHQPPFPQPQQQPQPQFPQQSSDLHLSTLAPSQSNQYPKLRPFRRALKTSRDGTADAGKGKGKGKGVAKIGGSSSMAGRNKKPKPGLVLLEPKTQTSAETALGFVSAAADRREGWLCRGAAAANTTAPMEAEAGE